jgi:hypothetical protein
MDTLSEPSGDELEWASLLRYARVTGRELLKSCNDAHDFAMIVESLEMLASFDPAYGSQFADESKPVDTVSVDGAKDDGCNDDEKDDDEKDGGSPVPVGDEVKQ